MTDEAGDPRPGAGHGVYGLALEGIDGARRLLLRTAADAPVLRVSRETCASPVVVEHVDGEHGLLRLHGGGRASIDRAAGRAHLVLSLAFEDEEILHPFLSGPAALVNRWLGRDTFHAGAFVDGEGAWGVVGNRGAGKSSLLGCLATRGIPVLTDDLLVVDDGRALAGPRCVDLRPGAAERLGVGENLGIVGSRPRWRYVLPSVATSVPLVGWVAPAWGERVGVTRIPVIRRLPLLFEHLALNLVPLQPEVLMTLAALRCFELVRPRSWDRMDEVVDALLAATGGRAIDPTDGQALGAQPRSLEEQ